MRTTFGWRMNHLARILKSFLVIWGSLSLLGVLAVAGFVGFQLGPGNKDRVDTATANDVRFVLNWCELGEQRIDHVVHSHISARSLTGDHLDAYAIRVKNVTADELSHHDSLSGQGWWRGDELSPVLQNAVALVSDFVSSDRVAWFPTQQDLLSERFYLYPWQIVLHGTEASAAQIIFVDPSQNMVFYASVKT